MQLTTRISLNMTVEETGETKYCDVVKNTIGSVVGVANDSPVILFNTVVNGVGLTATAAMKVSNLTLDVNEDANPATKKGGSSGSGDGPSLAGSSTDHLKGYEFLKAKDNETIKFHKDWTTKNATKHTQTQVRNLHSRLGHTLAAIIDQCPVYGPADFCIIERNGKVEIWTSRDFAAKEILMAPECTEWKERCWTTGKSVLVKYGTQQPNVFCSMCFFAFDCYARLLY